MWSIVRNSNPIFSITSTCLVVMLTHPATIPWPDEIFILLVICRDHGFLGQAHRATIPQPDEIFILFVIFCDLVFMPDGNFILQVNYSDVIFLVGTIGQMRFCILSFVIKFLYMLATKYYQLAGIDFSHASPIFSVIPVLSPSPPTIDSNSLKTLSIVFLYKYT